jgi:hypothetical protein
MIELNTDTACMLYLGLMLMVILGIWLGRHFFSKDRPHSTSSIKRYRCEFCGFSYLEEGALPLSRCPQCSMISEVKPYRNRLEHDRDVDGHDEHEDDEQLSHE